MHLSKRLQAVAGLVTAGNRIADIGTDHAYVPIYLMEQNAITHAIAMDVNEGPLQKAKEHIALFGMTQNIETRLSDGLEKLIPGETDSVIIAGMGGALTIRILSQGEKQLRGVKELILQPQSEIAAVRTYLSEHQLEIVDEEMVEEEGKYYPMMRVVPVKQCRSMTEAELMFGPVLLQKKHPVLLQFLKREQSINEKILVSLQTNAAADVTARIAEVQTKLTQLHDTIRQLEQ